MPSIRHIYQCFPGRAGQEGMVKIGSLEFLENGEIRVNLDAYPSHSASSRESFMVVPPPQVMAVAAPPIQPGPPGAGLVRMPDGSWATAGGAMQHQAGHTVPAPGAMPPQQRPYVPSGGPPPGDGHQ